MQPVVHSFASLFDQLGLPSEEAEIQSFIASHRPLPGDVKITEAPFWTESQARLLKDLLKEDADWAEVVDQLNLALH